MRSSTRTIIAAVYLVLCLTLGGASSAGILANFLLQLLAAVLLIIVVLTEGRRIASRSEKGAWLLLAALVLLILVQLAPLPPGLWASLPGRERIVHAFDLIGVRLPWLPLSLIRDGTLRALVSLLPAVAILALVAPTSLRSRHIFLPLIIVFALVALVLGLTQIAGSRQSPLYFYAYTNWGFTVGFFANRNHQATLLLMTLPFVAALATPLLRGGRIPREAVPKISIIATLFAVIAGGVAMTGSRAGIALVPVVFAFCVLMVRKDLTGNVPRAWVAAMAAFLIAAIAGIGASGVVTRDSLSAGAVSESTREVIWGNTLQLAVDFQPAGSGLGSFVPLYRMQEDPLNRPGEFTNHAHNDYLEWFLETGLPGVLLLLAFLAWYGLNLRRVWSADDSALGRAGSIALGIVMLHSLVDYPIRTAAILALSSLCLALMLPAAPAPQQEERPAESSSSRRRRRSRR